MDQEKIDQDSIDRMSQESAREFLNEFIQRAAILLGLAAAKVTALLADLMQIGRNAGAAFKDGFRRGFEESRRIQPFGNDR